MPRPTPTDQERNSPGQRSFQTRHRLLPGLSVALLSGVAGAQAPLQGAGDSEDGWSLHSWFDEVRDRHDMRFTVDLSARGLYVENSEEFASVGALGFDVHKVIRGTSFDVGTLVLQGYLTKLNDVAMRPPFFEDEDDWEFVYRIFNYNHTALSRGELNLRVGHFELPYGLEHTINTNGTLLDYTHGRNLGVKADWGAGVNGESGGAEYEATISRGSGNEYIERDDPFALAARVGTDQDAITVVGLSAFHGEVVNPGAVATWASGLASGGAARDVGDIIRRTRFGLDLVHHLRSTSFLAELSAGRDYSQDVVNALLELDWHDPSEQTLLYLQGLSFNQRFDSGWVDEFSIVGGVRYAPDRHWSLSAQVTRQITNFADANDNTVFAVQLRHRF